MSLIEIPIQSGPDFSFSVLLDNNSYDIRFQWNGRDKAWYTFIGQTNLPPTFKTKVTNGSDILGNYRAYDSTPRGYLAVIDKEKVYGRLQRDSFSKGRFSLIYYTEDEIDFLRDSNLIR